MNEKHTPGPWFVIQRATRNINATVCDTSKHKKIVAIASTNGDASLIAAAPDLLEACRAVLASSALHGTPTPNDYRAMRAVVAKATGQSAESGVSPAFDAPELVEPDDACPRCGERRVDQLVWNADGDGVTCASCGNYKPAEPDDHLTEPRREDDVEGGAE